MTVRTLFHEEIMPLNWLKHLVTATVLGTVSMIALEFFHLMQASPKEAFDLLRGWGPNFLIGFLVVSVVGGLLSQLMDISRDGVQAQRQMAEAMGKIAEKDDRQLQEIQIMSSYNAQQAERMHRRMDRQDRAFALILRKLRISDATVDDEKE